MRSSTLQADDKKSGGEVLLDTGLSEEDELTCFGRKCLASDQCCRGSVCVDVDGSKREPFTQMSPSGVACRPGGGHRTPVLVPVHVLHATTKLGLSYNTATT
ncbi:hypothetical protein HPB48_016743 [Haemaphysalis longicornis]|uniref:Uncharacterized protein n=1 Tax=Haemaphysalis longicornis TaxID=44386 RepID=A0A9J6G3Z0_HAELO|nr:hypothetical protein HPB48_016743 [Haemaphysalis longicornis]